MYVESKSKLENFINSLESTANGLLLGFLMDCDCKNGSGYFALTSLTGQYNGYKRNSRIKCG